MSEEPDLVELTRAFADVGGNVDEENELLRPKPCL